MDEKSKVKGTKRGRPRTATDDQQRAEKRRKQLRQAQQAYRKRKDNTISALQNRVHELEGGIEQLRRSFLTFSSLLWETDILRRHSHITSGLQKITQQCVSLTRAGCDESDESDLIKTAVTTQDEVNRNEEWKNKYSSTQGGGNFVEHASIPVNSPKPSLQSKSLSCQDHTVLPFGLVVIPPAGGSPIAPSPLPYSPSTTSPASLIGEKRWSVAQLLVKVCCQYGYKLLVNTPHNAKIRAVFDHPLSPADRTSLITYFRAGVLDETGVLIDSMVNTFDISGLERNNLLPARNTTLPGIWGSMGISVVDEWLDASGVQRLLHERGYRVQQDGSSFSGPRLNHPLDMEAFVESLTVDCVCAGHGPAFRRRTVEVELRSQKRKAQSVLSTHRRNNEAS